MKNIFKFFSVMLVAGAMLCSCTDPNSDDPNNPTTPKYNITVTANNDAYGTVTGSGEYDSNTVATITATPNAGYTFVNWNDGATQNPRLVTVTADASYIANFEEIAGVNITFGTSQWTANYVNGQLATNAIMIAAAQNNSNQYPIVKINNLWGDGVTPAVGTYTGAHRFEDAGDGMHVNIIFGDAYVWYFENDGLALNDHTTAGDWWSKSCTINITALDADAMTTSMVVNAEMAYIPDILTSEGLISVDLNDCTAKSFTANIVNQALTQYQGGKGIAKKVTVKMAK